ncbi:histidine phosphatase family protein, partial [Kibdelosporangium lantanae]
ADVDQRAARALAHVHGTRVLIVSHEMIGRVLLRNLLDLDPADILDRAQPNGVVYEVDAAARTLTEVRGYPGSS